MYKMIVVVVVRLRTFTIYQNIYTLDCEIDWNISCFDSHIIFHYVSNFLVYNPTTFKVLLTIYIFTD